MYGNGKIISRHFNSFLMYPLRNSSPSNEIRFSSIPREISKNKIYALGESVISLKITFVKKKLIFVQIMNEIEMCGGFCPPFLGDILVRRLEYSPYGHHPDLMFYNLKNDILI